MDFFQSHIAATIGLVLATALLAGLLADLLRLPKVTAYLLVGILLGRSALGVLGENADHDKTLHAVTQLAMALVLFNLGCHFPLAHVRRIARPVSRLALGDIGLTFALVALGLLAAGLWWGQHWECALLLGALAIATAPATTVLVLKESESEGQVTELAEALVVVNNFAAIVAFELALVLIGLLQGQFDSSTFAQLGLLAQDIFGSLALGAGTGIMVSFGCGLLAPNRWLVLLVAAATLLLGAAEILHIPYMLSFLAMGVTVANSSGQTANIVAGLDRLTGFLCVVFFVVHGANLNLNDFLAAGAYGAAYILLRSCGKILGVYLTAPSAGMPRPVRTWLGPSLIAQAGAAIALAEVASLRAPLVGREIQTIILGTVVFFELVGPLLIRYSVLCAGEVPLYRAVRHSSSTPWTEIKGIWLRLQVAWGRDPMHKKDPQQARVAELVRSNAPRLLESASFDQVTSLIEHSRDNTYAVVNEQLILVGVVRYSEISHVLFDLEAATLIRAEDLASPVRHKLHPDQSVEAALRLFRISNDDCIPVVTREDPHRFLGMVRRRDVVGYLVRRDSA